MVASPFRIFVGTKRLLRFMRKMLASSIGEKSCCLYAHQCSWRRRHLPHCMMRLTSDLSLPRGSVPRDN